MTSMCEVVEKMEPLCPIDGIIKLEQQLRKTAWGFLKKLKIEPPHDAATLLLGIYPKELRAGSQRAVWTALFIAALFTIAKR